MRLKAVQAVLLINREASQAERRRFEPGHPLETVDSTRLTKDCSILNQSCCSSVQLSACSSAGKQLRILA
jgi:hypothetical protein